MQPPIECMRFSAKTEAGDIGIQSKTNEKYPSDDFGQDISFSNFCAFLSYFVSQLFNFFETRSMEAVDIGEVFIVLSGYGDFIQYISQWLCDVARHTC